MLRKIFLDIAISWLYFVYIRTEGVISLDSENSRAFIEGYFGNQNQVWDPRILAKEYGDKRVIELRTRLKTEKDPEQIWQLEESADDWDSALEKAYEEGDFREIQFMLELDADEYGDQGDTQVSDLLMYAAGLIPA